MPDAITPLSNAVELISHLPLSAVTVVLLTAYWSFETDSARQALNVARTLVDCDPHSVSYYEVPISVHELHRTPPLSSWARVPWTEAHRAATAARNVTQGVPFLPAIRVFRNDRHGSEPYTHVDTFAPGALASHIMLHCAPEGRREKRGALAELSRYTTPVSKDRFAREMRKEEFRSLGLLFMVRGGARGIVDRWGGRWEAVAKGVGMVNKGKAERQDLRQRWILSIVDVEKEGEMGERNGVVDGEPAVTLVDVSDDRTETRQIGGHVSWEWVRDALLRFEQGFEQRSSVGGDRGVLPEEGDGRSKILSFLRLGRIWRQFFSRECRLCLRSYLSGDMSGDTNGMCDGRVVVVAHAPWCGFSQRVMGVYRRLGDEGVDTVVVGEREVGLLPRFLDEMVDGFPTVLVVREAREGEFSVGEFEGPHSMEAIMARVRGGDEDVRIKR